MYSNEYIQRGILYFDWDTKDFQKALPALISFPINGNSFPSFFIMLFIHPIYPISPFQCLTINLSGFLKLKTTFIFAIFAFLFISFFGIWLPISCFYSKTTPENVQHVNTNSTLQGPARFNCDWSLLTENSFLFFFLQLKKQDIDFNLLWDNFLLAWYGLISRWLL